jgi:hypothetical protein
MVMENTNFFIPRPSKIYPNSDFWFEYVPSGNPAGERRLSVEEIFHPSMFPLIFKPFVEKHTRSVKSFAFRSSSFFVLVLITLDQGDRISL